MRVKLLILVHFISLFLIYLLYIVENLNCYSNNSITIVNFRSASDYHSIKIDFQTNFNSNLTLRFPKAPDDAVAFC